MFRATPITSATDTPQTPSYQKLSGRLAQPGKQIAHEMLPSRAAKATITAGDPTQRSANYYGKMTPADASGVGQIGYNILSMGRNTPRFGG